VALVGVDRDAFEALLDEVAEDRERRPARVRGGPDDRDPMRRSKGALDPGVVEDRDRPATLLEIQEGCRAVALRAAFLGGQVAASRS
jgi:hypothetical protein